MFIRNCRPNICFAGWLSGNIYEKWSKATKRRIQKVGEVEDVDALGKLRTGWFSGWLTGV
jgi:hypothetical protein